MGPLLSLKRHFEYVILLLVVLDHFESIQLPITSLWYKSLEPVSLYMKLLYQENKLPI